MDKRTRSRRLAVLGALVVTALLAACGGDDDDDDTSAQADTETTVEAADEADDSSDDEDAEESEESAASSDDDRRCPLSSEDVSAAVGATVEKDEGSCTYYPTGDDIVPNVAFNRQHDFACDDPSEIGYNEELEGLGVEAYVQPDTALGSMILVCSDNTFEITIDMAGDSGPEIEAAKALAKIVLEGE